MNPTPSSRIAATTSLLKGIVSVLHPPLPLTPRESDKLLRTVQDSFRSHLTSDPAESDPYSSPNAHLTNVLKMAPFAPSPEEARKQREQRVKRYLVDPIGVFEEHVALGTASIDLARSCLGRYNDLKISKPRAGASRVLKGLIAAGLLDRPECVFDDGALSASVTIAMTREGQEGVLVRWALARDVPAPPGLVRNLIRHVEKNVSLDRAAEVFFEFYEHYGERLDVRADLGTVGRELCQVAHQAGRMKEPVFQRLLVTADRWTVSRVEHTMIQLRFGDNVEPGLAFFSFVDRKPPQWWQGLPEKKRRIYARVGIELAQRCLAKDQLGNAQMLAGVLVRRMPEQLGVPTAAPAPLEKSGEGLPQGEFAEHLVVFREMFKLAAIPPPPEPVAV